LVGHDLSMRILYRLHGWSIFARVIALFMFVWPYVHPHILCTQLVICLLSHFIHIWYLGWPWSEHAHIIPISPIKVDFCESYSPFHVCLTIRSSTHLVCATSHLSFVAFYSYLVSWLAMIWDAHILPISPMVDFCESYSPFHVCLTIRSSTHLAKKSTIREIGKICVCSDHGQTRYQIWIKCDKRQMTSCVHKTCGRTYGQTNMKRAITLAKINHRWNR
jgi:hypothetical protein